MSGSFPSGHSGTRGFTGGHPGPGPSVLDAIDQLRSMFEQRVGSHAAPGDVRAATLALVAEGPKSGQQIIAEIEKRSGGAWKPSAGAVYPTLQLLVDEGLVESQLVDGRKTYALTDSGRAETDAAAGGAAPWDASGGHDVFGRGGLPKAGIDLAHAAVQVARTGTPAQVEQAVTVLDEARRKLYSILAQD